MPRLRTMEEHAIACRAARRVLQKQMGYVSEIENDPMSDYVGFHPPVDFSPFVEAVRVACDRLGISLANLIEYLDYATDKEYDANPIYCPPAHDEASWLEMAIDDTNERRRR